MKVAILKAVGDGGLMDPRTGNYISSKRNTIAPFTDWAESLANHDKIEVVEVIEGSDWGEYVNHLGEAQGDEEKALEAYRKVVPSADKNVERMRVVENAADLEAQEAREAEDDGGRKQRGRPRAGETAVAKNDAPASKPAAE